VTVVIQAMSFNTDETPLDPSQKPAGAVVEFPRPRGAEFMKPIKFEIKISRWILVLLGLLNRRRELAEGHFSLDEDELENVYLDNGALMWRGRRLLQAGMREVNKVQQATFDKGTGVSARGHA
jgi:hypothetical protein